MKRGRVSYDEQTRARLLDLWRGEEKFGRPIGCVTTTFTFDPELFEEQCLARFLSIESNPNETAKAYLIEREEKLSQCFACVLVDRAHVAPDRSLRWNLLPVTLPHGGALHAKLTILAWQHCVRVLIGSANLTEPGYRRNQEVMAALDFEVGGDLPPDLLQQCVDFVDGVRRFSPGATGRNAGPQAALEKFLRSVELQAKTIPAIGRPDAQCALVSLLPGRASVIEQLRSLWKGPAPVAAYVLSPFYDKDEVAAATAKKFSTLLTTKGHRGIVFTAPGRRLPESVEIDLPASLRESSHPSLEHQFAFVNQRIEMDNKMEDRLLHAKSIWLERDGHVLYLLGSSNFTEAGLGLHPSHNIELNVAYVIRDQTSKFGKLCADSWPRDEKLNDLNDVKFLADGLVDSSDNPEAPLLPAAFGLALYCVESGGVYLELEIGNTAPRSFEVCNRDGTVLLDASQWVQAGCQGRVKISWDRPRPPSALDVRWRDEEKGQCVASWIVNVEDVSSLPPPGELGSLTLAELMEILTSARPLHETVMRILERREKKQAPGATIVVDPHKRVDTSQFLLRRMRRVAEALEGLRARLQRPAGTLEAIRWRLQGPIGPVALAKRLAEEDPAGAAFMICEVAATVRDVVWQPIGSLGLHEVNLEVTETIRVLRNLAKETLAPPSLADYVNTSFGELLA